MKQVTAYEANNKLFLDEMEARVYEREFTLATIFQNLNSHGIVEKIATDETTGKTLLEKLTEWYGE